MEAPPPSPAVSTQRARPPTTLAVLLGVLLAVAALVGVGALLFAAIAAREEAGAWVRHSLEVEKETEEVAHLLAEAETGQRGFLLTDRDEYLAPYHDARDALPGHLAELRLLTKDNPRQQARLDRLAPLTAAKLDELEATVTLHARGEADAALARVRTEEGKRTMDAIRLLLQEVRVEEELLLEQRRRAMADAHARLLGRLAGGLLCIAAAIGGVVFLMLRSGRETAAREAQFRSIFEAASEGIWILDEDARITMANAAMSELLGYPLQDIVGRVYWEHFLFPEDVAFARELFQRRRKGISEATDLRFRHRSGRPVWTLLSARSIHGPGGSYRGALDFFTDITQRRMAEERGRFLAALGARFLEPTPPEELATATTEALRTFLGVERCAFVEVDEVRGRLVKLGQSVRNGAPGPTERPLASLGPFAADVLAGRRVVVEDAARVPLANGMADGARAWVLVPRRQPEGGIAMLGVESRHAREWTPGDLELITSVADRGLLAVENARLQRDLARRFVELDAIYAQASVGLAFLDRDGRIVRVNAALARIHGLSPAEGEGRHLSEVCPFLWPRIEGALARVIDGGESAVELEVDGADAAGDPRTWLSGNYAVRDTRGVVQGVGLVVQDITLRKRAQEELRAGSALLRLVADTVPDLLHALDREHRITLANPAFLALVGKAEGEVLGHTVRDWWFDPKQVEATLAIDERVMTTGQVEREEEEYGPPGGEPRVYQTVKAPLRGGDGRVIGLVGVSRDVTAERGYARHLERMVSERTASLSRSLASLEQLLYSIAHDLRAPNRAVHSFAELLEMEVGDRLDPRSRLYLERIKRAALRNDQLILDLLEYGRLAHADVPVEAVQLDEVVREALLDLEVLVSERRASVRVGEALPRVYANRTLLKQVLVNVVANAVKYVAAERVPEVELTAEERDGYAEIEVLDIGVGIAPDQVGRVFEPFARLPNATGVPGTGMGLAIVRKAVERMHGEVGVDARSGGGSRFWVRLPLVPPPG